MNVNVWAKFFWIFGLAASLAEAAPRGIYPSKTIFTKRVKYDYYFNESNKIIPHWKSFTTKLSEKDFNKKNQESCEVKIDIKRDLIQNHSSCDFTKISFYSADSMWLGNVESPYTVESYSSYRSIELGVDYSNLKEIAFVDVEFTPSNYWNPDSGIVSTWQIPPGIRCKDGEDFLITKNYAVEIDKKYYLTDGESEFGFRHAVCASLSTPPKGYYFTSEKKTVAPLPDPAHMIASESFGYECKDTRILYDEKCIEEKECGDSAYFDFETESCVQCDDREILTDDGCENIPDYSTKISPTEWKCSDGYLEQNGSCVRDKSCNENSYFEYFSETCQSIPAGAHKTRFDNWECNDGYFKTGNRCQSIPANAHKTGFDDWECNDGYLKQNGSCLELRDCGPNAYFDLITKSCIYCDDGEILTHDGCERIPDHSVKTSAKTWECTDGYLKQNGTCVFDESCDETSYFMGGSCNNIPANAHKDGFYAYECSEGFSATENGCESQTTVTGLGEFLSDMNFGYRIWSLDFKFIAGVEILSPKIPRHKQVSVSFYGMLGMGSAFADYESSSSYYFDEADALQLMFIDIGGGLGLRLYRFAFDIDFFGSYYYLDDPDLNVKTNRGGVSFTAGIFVSDFFEIFGQIRTNHLAKISDGRAYTNYGPAIGGFGAALLW